MIGKPIKTLIVRQDRHSALSIDQPERFAHVDLKAPFIPAYITGQFHAGASRPTPTLAVTINGTIQAVSQPWIPLAQKDRGRWSALVPEEAFKQGHNDVEVFVVVDDAGHLSLARATE